MPRRVGAILQPDEGPRTGQYVSASVDHVAWGTIRTAGATPVATVEPGETFTVDTISHEGVLGDQGRDPVAFFAEFGVGADQVLADAVALAASRVPNDPDEHGPHVVTGLVEVAGAEPGDLLSVEVLDLLPRVPYGIVSNRHACGALAGEFPEPTEGGVAPPLVCRFATSDWETGTAVVHAPGGLGLRLALRPFLGLVAVAPRDDDVNSVPPGPYGGNLDVRLLGRGTRLHLPVRCPGALLQLGDPHFAQGDGEVALTAFEASLRAVLRVDLVKGGCPSWDLPYGETDDAWLILGLHEDLDEAVRIATRAAITFVTDRTGVDRATAYAWLSAAADLSVSQVVDGVKGVHFALPKAWLAATA
ncbi:MAG TPA: acetamidase/formamidase family protein [Acidimicrobiales bacterium]|nr:acetamidase/formamidase family protein [Acidimicrobiales bacterium]